MSKDIVSLYSALYEHNVPLQVKYESRIMILCSHLYFASSWFSPWSSLVFSMFSSQLPKIMFMSLSVHKRSPITNLPSDNSTRSCLFKKPRRTSRSVSPPASEVSAIYHNCVRPQQVNFLFLILESGFKSTWAGG